jgi:uncharacterized protein YdhG (YjbR/CyaY superfamily)
MPIAKKHIGTVDAYIAAYPEPVRKRLEEMRTIIKEEAPDGEECISYRMPAFKMGGRSLVYFGAFSKHIGFYPTSSGIAAFEKDLSKYVHAKGSVQFSMDKPLPKGLIKKIVKFRVKENKTK